MLRAKIGKGIVIVLVFLLAFVLIFLPANFFDTGQSICISVLLFNQQCWGCGMTRAIQHLIHLDFEIAYHLNRLSFLVLPLFIFMIFWELVKKKK